MDGNNIAWQLEGPGHGYPAGDFFRTVLLLVFDPPKDLSARLDKLIEIFGRADSRHGDQLDWIFPELRPYLQRIYDGLEPEAETVTRLTPLLLALPVLLARLPEIVTSVDEYVRNVIPESSDEPGR